MLETKHQDFVLHSISPPVVNQDIAVFIKDHLRQSRLDFGLEAGWPGIRLSRT